MVADTRSFALKLVLPCLFAFLFPHAALCAQAPVTSVQSVDLNRYAGQWFEIASFPMFFQRHCISDTRATYTILDPLHVRVFNQCLTANGEDHAQGKAEPVAGTGNAQLRVSFFWPFWADYWVIGLDKDYRWAVVGTPSRKYLWILSRTPSLAPELLNEALAQAKAQHFDLTQLKYTRQSLH